ncbi:MAG: xanthine dehydrogenase accessory protein XdhC [Paracoccaceae bacterium]
MSFDVQALRDAVAVHGRVARVVVAQVQGSAPREVGAAMLVWPGGQSGTIGGGALELDAAARALTGEDWLERIALGPARGQCCGGAVTLVAQVWDAAQLAEIDGDVVVRRARGAAQMPLQVKALLRAARASDAPIETGLVAGWMIEPIAKPSRHVWIYGAGHVGRAIVSVLAPLPDVAITWVDSSADRFPLQTPETITQLVAGNPADVVQYAPSGAEHLVLTYSHAMDLEICHQLLSHGFAKAGLIGSKTKWARFGRKLAALGHSQAQISQIRCPIGRPELGKHPQAIAIGVAGEFLAAAATLKISQQRAG